MTTRIIRSPGAPFGYAMCVIGVLGFAVVGVVNRQWIIGTAFLLLAFACGILSGREAVLLRDEGLTVRNLFRTYKMSWSDLQDVEVAQQQSPILSELWPVAVASLVTRDGRHIRLGATRVLYQTFATASEKGEIVHSAWTASLPKP